MNSLSINVIGDKKEKGRALEQQFGYVLNHLGYTDLSFNIHKTGEELDVKGFSKLFGEPLIAECKAHKKQIGTGDIRKFFSSFQTSFDKNPQTHGIFLSLSGYNSTALEWYEENVITEKKKIFKLLNGKDLTDILNKENLLCSLDKLKANVSSITSLPSMNQQILLTDRSIFWKISVYASSSDTTYIIFLKSNGETILKPDIEYILKRLSLGDEKILQINDRHQLISCLYDLSEKSPEDLSKNIQQPIENVQTIIDELFAEKIIEATNEKIKLKEEFPACYLIYKECREYSLKDLINFMSEKYYLNQIDKIIDYTSIRFKLKKEIINDLLIGVLKISPKCLEFCLEGDTKPYNNAYKQIIEGKTATEELKDKFYNKQFKYFSPEIISLLFHECTEETSLKKLHIKEEINIIYASLKLKLGSQQKLYLQLNAEYPIMLLELASGKSINKGEWVSAQGIETYIEIGNRYLGIAEYDKGIEAFDFVIKNASNPLPRIKAQINKIIALMQKDEFIEANEIKKELEESEQFELLKNEESIYNVYKRNSDIIKEKLKNINNDD